MDQNTRALLHESTCERFKQTDMSQSELKNTLDLIDEIYGRPTKSVKLRKRDLRPETINMPRWS